MARTVQARRASVGDHRSTEIELSERISDDVTQSDLLAPADHNPDRTAWPRLVGASEIKSGPSRRSGICS